MFAAYEHMFMHRELMFAAREHKFAVHEHMFIGGEHKFTEYEYKIVKCMENFVLQELPDEMTDGKNNRLIESF